MSSPWKKHTVEAHACSLRDVMSEQLANQIDENDDRELADALAKSLEVSSIEERRCTSHGR